MMLLTLLKSPALWNVICYVLQKPKLQLIRITSIGSKLWMVSMFFNNSSEQTLLNITICFPKNVSLLSRNNLLVFPIFLFLKSNFTKNILRFLCFISAQTLPLLWFIDRLGEIVHLELHIDFMLSNFNLNMFNNSNDGFKTCCQIMNL